jgi:threonine synthase
MRYISSRGNHPPVSSAQAINLGMVPEGGLFVPESIPLLETLEINNSYQDTACKVFAPFLTDFSEKEITDCVNLAYNSKSFDSRDIIDLVDIGKNRFMMGLYHGPTAAFKDMALQIMPHFLTFSKEKIANRSHTIILVATSGDTGKAALEGFKNCEGISVIVFYPSGGVSEIQRLQMNTTDGDNTYVIAVNGNFDDCQTGVKNLFSDLALKAQLQTNGFEFSSANSINWGRLCPQIVYYFQSYLMLVKKQKVSYGDPVDYCVPTGNFGNILAGYYAKSMGLPIRKLICASNKNNILTNFFHNGTYDRNRAFYKTISPSMDILISSNLERFLFEITGHDAFLVNEWYKALGTHGKFSIGSAVKRSIDSLISAGWVDEETVLSTISDVYHTTSNIIDTHTAVAVAVLDNSGTPEVPTVIASTASPYKFSCDVLKGIKNTSETDEFSAIKEVASLSGKPIHRAVDGLEDRAVRHDQVINLNEMKDSVKEIIKSIQGKLQC